MPVLEFAVSGHVNVSRSIRASFKDYFLMMDKQTCFPPEVHPLHPHTCKQWIFPHEMKGQAHPDNNFDSMEWCSI